MAGRIQVRDLELLLDLQTNLSQFNYGALEVISMVDREIRSCQEKLQQRMGYWQVELRKREAALHSCQSDKENRGCRAELAAVHQAQDAIEQLRKLSNRIEQAVGEYGGILRRYEQLLYQKITKGKGDLEKSINKYQRYLAHQNGRAGSSSHKTHGYEYQRERHKFILNTIHEHRILTNVSSSIRGDLITKVRNKGENSYIRSPKGYHVGHKFPGWNHWSNYRWEESGMNSFRGGKFKR